MPPLFGQAEPLPGVEYGATMQTSDIYPAVMGIGGVRTQDYTIPVFAEGAMAARNDAHATASLPAGLFNSPAGWAIVALAGLAGLVLYHAEKR